MIENFPKLKEGEVALLRAETLTGHILDEQLELAVNDSQKTYTVINSSDEALSVAKNLIAGRSDIECVIYGKDKEVFYFLNSQNIGAK